MKNYSLSCLEDPQNQENFLAMAAQLVKWYSFMVALHSILIAAILVEFIKRIYTRKQLQAF